MNTPPTQVPPYSALVQHAEPIDGDTIRVDLDRGFYDYKIIHCRLAGIDTPEIGTDAGKLVRQVVENWIRTSKRLAAVSYAKDKFSGRFIGDLLHVDDLGFVQDSLVAYLQRASLCRSYDGGKKCDWTPEQLASVEASARKVLA